MANTNRFQGLARGPIDHQSSSVINSISNGAITMGSSVKLIDINLLNPVPAETLPRVAEVDANEDVNYGIAVGGDIDGIYGDGSASTDDSTRASTGAGQGVVVVTQGRCLARVAGTPTVNVATALVAHDTLDGVLTAATGGANEKIIARALRAVASGDVDMIPVDVQREGEVP